MQAGVGESSIGLEPDALLLSTVRVLKCGDPILPILRNVRLVGEAISVFAPSPVAVDVEADGPARWGEGEGDSRCLVRLGIAMVVANGFDGEGWIVKVG